MMLAGATLIGFAIVNLNDKKVSKNPDTTGEEKNPDTAWKERAQAVSNGLREIVANSAPEDIVEYITEQAKNSKSADEAFNVQILGADFLSNNKKQEAALSYLLGIDESSLDDEQKYHLYLSIAFAYRANSDENSEKIYREKIDQLPKTVTIKGE